MWWTRGRVVRCVAVLGLVASAGRAPLAQRQPDPPPRIVSRDSVTIAASTRFGAGPVKRFFFGDTYRDLWLTPIRVPVLHIDEYAGGLTPLKEGGGYQTKNLRFSAANGAEYVFRPVAKALIPRGRLNGTRLGTALSDYVSALFPAGGVVIAPIAAATGVLHPTPAFAVMADDPSLGKFRKDFAGVLGTIEEYPNKPEEGPGFGGGSDVIDSEELLPLLDSLPTHAVDARAFLNARLTDFLVADTDRHLGNWKWARFGSGKAVRWVPIARDRDHAFHNYDGLLARLGSLSEAFIVKFEGRYAGIDNLSDNSRELDRRLLAGLERAVWDSIARAITERVTDRVIDSAVRRMPPEYQHVAPAFAAKLRQRREGLAAVAGRFYDVLADVVDVHATDAGDRATVTYLPGGVVDVKLRAGGEGPYYHRRFDPRESREVRVYLHDGDDSAVVRGSGTSPIQVRVIGGNGTNSLVDSSHAASRGRPHLYDVGRVSGIYYGPDSVRDTLFNRRPWVNDTGVVAYPSDDVGRRLSPVAGFGTGGLGLVPRIGVRWRGYGFRKEPYSTMLGLDAEYATGVPGFRLTALADKRLESSRLHVTGMARMSDLEVVNFYGFGNATTDEAGAGFFRADQRQWLFRPALALALGRRESDLTVGPVVQYSSTASNGGRLIAETTPYGFGDFGQAGLRVGLRYDRRDAIRGATHGFLVDMNATTFPAIWDVTSAFSQTSGSVASYVRLPVPLHPVLALRAGGRKVWGDAPFHDAAFLGGVDTLTGVDPQRYAGDASVFGNSELRVPVASVKTWIRLDVGVLGFADAGRVYVDGDSAGGWHSVGGAGLWAGVLDPATGVSVLFTNSRDRRVVVGTGLRF